MIIFWAKLMIYLSLVSFDSKIDDLIFERSWMHLRIVNTILISFCLWFTLEYGIFYKIKYAASNKILTVAGFSIKVLQPDGTIVYWASSRVSFIIIAIKSKVRHFWYVSKHTTRESTFISNLNPIDPNSPTNWSTNILEKLKLV